MKPKAKPYLNAQALNGTPCPYCGEPYEVSLLEILPEDRSFQIQTCCEGSEEEIRFELTCLEEDPKGAARFLESLGWSSITGQKPRSLYIDVGHVEVNHGLKIVPVTFPVARDFIAQHHRHNKPPPGWRFGFAVHNWPHLVAVATCGRPVARRLDRPNILEITRVCTNPHLPEPVTRYACSALYFACLKEAERRGYERVITYTLQTERGVSVSAAGFKKVALTANQKWDRRRRRRHSANTPAGVKVRWEKHFVAIAEARGQSPEPHAGGQLNLLVTASRTRPVTSASGANVGRSSKARALGGI